MAYILEITVRDESRTRLDTIKCKGHEFHKIVGFLFKKYGIKAMKQKDKDLKWLGKANW